MNRNEIESHFILRGPAGIRATLEMIFNQAVIGGRLVYVSRFVSTVPLDQWDTVLREYWDYQDEDAETLRSVRLQIESLMRGGKLIGDCDDAAIVSGALAQAAHLPFVVVAVRAPTSHEFTHVFVEVVDVHTPRERHRSVRMSRMFKLDPTAPPDANYSDWERMVYP
jgi:hypothetical protein